MLGDISVADNIYIVCGTTDMRKSIDGLCSMIRDKLSMNPDQSSLFLTPLKIGETAAPAFHDQLVLHVSWYSDIVTGHFSTPP